MIILVNLVIFLLNAIFSIFKFSYNFHNKNRGRLNSIISPLFLLINTFKRFTYFYMYFYYFTLFISFITSIITSSVTVIPSSLTLPKFLIDCSLYLQLFHFLVEHGILVLLLLHFELPLMLLMLI